MTAKKSHTSKRFKKYQKDILLKTYVQILAVITLIFTLGLLINHKYHNLQNKNVMGHRTEEKDRDLPYNNQITITPSLTVTIVPTISITPTPTATPTITVTATPTAQLTVTPTESVSLTTESNPTSNEPQSTITTPLSTLQKYFQNILRPSTVTKPPLPTITKQPSKPLATPTPKKTKDKTDGPIIIKIKYGPNVIQEEGLENSSQDINQNNNVSQKIITVNETIDKLVSEFPPENNGEQLNMIIEEQKQSQIAIEEQLKKIENRNNLLSIFLGPDYKAINYIKLEIEKTQNRIVQLQQFQNTLENSVDIDLIKQAIIVLQDQNTVLNFYLSIENGSPGILEKYFSNQYVKR